MKKLIAFCLLGSALTLWRVSAQVEFPDKLGNAAQIDQFNFEKVAQFKKVMTGDQADKALLKLAAEYFVYRTTWFDRMQADPEKMFKVRTDFDRDPGSVLGHEHAFGDGLVAAFLEIGKAAFHDLEDLGRVDLPDIHGHELLVGIPEEPFGGPVGVDDIAVVIDGMDHVGEAVEQDLEYIGVPDLDLIYAHPTHGKPSVPRFLNTGARGSQRLLGL